MARRGRMEFVNIPLVPQWNLISSCASTPDDGFLYIGTKCINYVSNIQYKKVDDNSDDNDLHQNHKPLTVLPPLMKVFHTRQRVKCLDCDPDWSKTKYFSVLADDNSVQIWDFDESKAKFGHKAHIKQVHGDGDGPPLEMVRICFLKNRYVLSIDSSCLVMYCVQSNTYTKRKRIIPLKHEISIIKGSTYDENIIAAGSTRGLILLADLKLETVLCTLRGHDTEITSLSWVRILNESNSSTLSSQVITIIPNTNKKDVKSNQKLPLKRNQNDDIFDIYDYDYLENEFGAPATSYYKENTNTEEAEKMCSDPNGMNENFNYEEACQNLKEDIIALKDGKDLNNSSAKQVTLKDCKEAVQNLAPNSNSSISCASGSLELIDQSTDDDETSADVNEIIHKVDIHREGETNQNVTPIKLEENCKEEKCYNIYLASGSHESTIWIWDTKTGASVDKLNLKNSSQNSFIEVCWLNDYTLITNTKSGELVQWNRVFDPKKKLAFKQDKKQFSQRGVVSLSKLMNSERIWTVSFYREIICEDLKDNKIIAKYSCASTNITTIRERPDDMNKIAFACADRRIGILNISNISGSHILIENCSNKIDSAVMALSWSGIDSLLAFGTMEGRIGIIDTEKPSNVPFLMNPFCGKPIYSIQWVGKQLFVCGNRKVAFYDTNRKNKDPYVLHEIDDASSISVNNNLLLVGTQSGKLCLYRVSSDNPCKYEFLSEHQLSTKYISEISWSPIARNRCAVVSYSNSLWIFTLKNGEMSLERSYSMGDINSSGNASVKWSNRNENLLLTSGFDGAIRIWDLSKNLADRHIFLKQFNCPMLCGLFAPLDESVVICAGKATSIEMFDIRKEKQTEFTAGVSSKLGRRGGHKEKPMSDVQWATKMIVSGSVNTSKERKRNRKRMSNKSKIISTTEESESKEVIQLMEQLDLEAHTKQEKQEDSSGCSGALFLKNHSTMLHLIAKESNKDALENLMKILQETNSENEIRSKRLLSMKLFGTRQDIQELLDDELRNHYTSGTKSIANVLIPQIKGDLKDEILKCVQNKKLTEWHVSLAPTISYDFWKKCCVAYAHQLLEVGLILQASTYLLACHDMNEVIQQFLNGNYYREAWVIAKIYKESDDPILHEILEKWISYLEMNGHFEGASLICALSKQYRRCHTILNKRQKPTGEHSKILDFLKLKLEKSNE